MTRLGHGSLRCGYTLVELLIATTLTLVMMGGVATVFGMIGGSVSSARAGLEMADALRATAHRLRADLDGVTVIMSPPRRPENNQGYFEYIDGPMGPLVAPGYVARNTDVPRVPVAGDPDQIPYQQDSTVGDMDDVLAFTTRSRGGSFVGRFAGSAIESQDAEVAWFVRGRTLYRRVLLVAPSQFQSLDINDGTPPPGTPDGRVGGGDVPLLQTRALYELFDISVRAGGTDAGGYPTWIANTLGDLTRPENRFAHQSGSYPYHAHWVSGWAAPGSPANALARLNLPLLQECSDPSWVAGASLPTVSLNPNVQTASNPNDPLPFDAWLNPHPWKLAGGNNPAVYGETGALLAYGNGSRVGEDVILSNVIGFDVKAWDPAAPVLLAVNDNGTPTTYADDTLVTPNVVVLPGDLGFPLALAHLTSPPIFSPIGYGAYVDLGYGGASLFGSANYDATGANPGPRSNLVRIYDTWSLHYEYDGVSEVGNTAGLTSDAGTNGFDDDGNGVVDDWNEMETQAPYPVPLRGIQIKIRVFEPDSRQIREVTIVHDFLAK